MTDQPRIQARRPSSTTPPEPVGETCPVEPPSILPPELVESVTYRVERAVRWANWDFAHRVIHDAKRAADERSMLDLQPLDSRPVESLYELVGLPLVWCRALSCVKPGRRPPILVGDVVRYGEVRLGNHDPWTPQRARWVFASIEVARRQIARAVAHYSQWTLSTTEVAGCSENEPDDSSPKRSTRPAGRRAAQNHTIIVQTAWPARMVTRVTTAMPGPTG